MRCGILKRIHFIVNHVAGAGRCDRSFEYIKKRLFGMGIDHTFEHTMYTQHAIELARNAARERKDAIIVAVGGDGTVQEVAKGLLNTGAIMGILPFGTGNDLARTLSIPTDPDGALDVLLGGNILKMDLGDCNDELFLNVAGIGFDSEVVYATGKYKRFGKMAYLLGVLETLLRYRGLKLRIDVDGIRMKVDALLIDVANGAYYGGGMNVAPGADPFDNAFNICVIKKVNVLRFLLLLPGFMKGKHITLNDVLYFNAKDIRVECDKTSRLQLDGELTFAKCLHFRMRKYRQPIIVGKNVTRGIVFL